jgi:arabinofuranosyltransferase
MKLPFKNPRAMIFWSFAAVSVIIGLVYIYIYFWACDDAFISFSYARNFARGLGLVFNPGERVEGYTNFLWTIIIAAGMRFGLDPVSFSEILGGFFGISTILLLTAASWKLQSQRPGSRLLIPIAALAICLHREFAIYATGGLETAMFTFLVTLAGIVLIFYRTEKTLTGAGIVMALVILTRPDGMIFFAANLLYLVVMKKGKLRSLSFFCLPVVMIYLPYWLWRYSYYGYFFPNTFYAKSIDIAYYSQGLEYFRLYLESYYVLFFLPLLMAAIGLKYRETMRQWISNKPFLHSISTDHPALNTVVLGSVFILLQTLFVIRIGGDFMFGRFFVPITPIAFFMMETLVVFAFRELVTIPIIIAIVLATYFRFNFFSESPINGYIADEWLYYHNYPISAVEEVGTKLNALLHDVQVRVAYRGASGRLVYYMDPQLAVEGVAGLTDTTLAHREITKRARPGHEKPVPFEYLVERRVQFFFDGGPEEQNSFRKIDLFGISATLVIYDNAVMSRLAGVPGVHFSNLPDLIDQYLSQLSNLDRTTVEKDYALLKSVYFDFNDDTLRENAFKMFLQDSTRR